jgi:exosortase/archaeosortase family protein
MIKTQLNIDVIIKCCIILASTIILYYNYLSIIFTNALVLTAGNLSNYILVIPFMIAFILYKKRNLLLTIAKDNDSNKLEVIIGASLLALSISLSVTGIFSLYSLEYNIWSIPIFIAGNILILFNFTMLRHLFILLLLLIYLQPLPEEFISGFAADLSYISAVIIEVILKIFLPIQFETSYGAPALVITKNGINTPFYIGEPSSGIFSLVSLSLFGLFIAYILRGNLLKRIIIFVVGLPIFFILNIIRIMIIILLWYNYGYNVSETFHAFSGIFSSVIGTFSLLLISDKLLYVRLIMKSTYDKCLLNTHTGDKFCLVCGKVLMSINKVNKSSISRISIIILTIVAGVSIQSYANIADTSILTLDINNIKGPETTGILLPSIEGYSYKYLYRDTRVESILNQDAALAYSYSRVNTTIPIMYVSIQISSGIHTWEGSMIIYPSKVGRPSATVIELTNVDITDGQSARFFVYKRPNSNITEAVLYWFERVPLRFGNNYEYRNVQIILWNNVNALVKNGILNDINDIERLKQFYISMALPIAAYWNNIESSTKGELFKNTLLIESLPHLSYILLTPAMIISLYYYIQIYNIQRNITSISNKLDNMSKIIMNILKKHMTAEEIYDAYKKTDNTVTLEQIIDKLNMLLEAHLITYYISGDSNTKIYFKNIYKFKEDSK